MLAYFCGMAGIYIHIPFCKKACHYCDFHFSTSVKYKDEILKALSKEIQIRKPYLEGHKINTIYFGGGTPSLLTASEINTLINVIENNFLVSDDAEITFEANPDDLHQSYLQSLKETRINRFSIGIQSFFEEDLQWMNRAHTASEADTCIKRAQDSGFENLSIDLIYGYPILTHEKWRANLQQVISLHIPHISSYSLTVEPKTALAGFIKKGIQKRPDDEQSADQFIFLMGFLAEKKYEHYEISNFCLTGQYSKHNTNYWKGVPYLGIGPSAHSYNGDSRQWNVANNQLYMKALFEGEISSTMETLSDTDKVNEYTMMGLRTKWGVNIQLFTEHEKMLVKSAQQFIAKEWMTLTDNNLKLTRKGKLYADHIASELFVNK